MKEKNLRGTRREEEEEEVKQGHSAKAFFSLACIPPCDNVKIQLAPRSGPFTALERRVNRYDGIT